MSLKLCPVQEVCQFYRPWDNKPPNHDVRDKYICKKYIGGCEHALYVESVLMGLTIACPIDRRDKV